MLNYQRAFHLKTKNYENSAVSKQRNEAFEKKTKLPWLHHLLGGWSFQSLRARASCFHRKCLAPSARSSGSWCKTMASFGSNLVKWVWSIVGVQPVCAIFDHHPKIMVSGASLFPTWKNTLRWMRCRQLDCAMGYLWVINHLPSEMHIQVVSASMQLTTHCRLVFYAH